MSIFVKIVGAPRIERWLKYFERKLDAIERRQRLYEAGKPTPNTHNRKEAQISAYYSPAEQVRAMRSKQKASKAREFIKSIRTELHKYKK